MSEKELMAADMRGPKNTWSSTASGAMATGVGRPIPNEPLPGCEIVALVVASGVSQQFDLQATGFFGSAKYTRKFVRMVSENAGNLHYAYTDATGTTIDRTATGGATGVCAFHPTGAVFTDELPAGRFLVIQPGLTGIVRLWITNTGRHS